MDWKFFELDKTVYSHDALLMTGVALASVFVLQADASSDSLKVKIRKVSNTPISEDDENLFLQHLAHNEIRFRLQKSFAPIENAIVKKAFDWN